MVSGGLWTDDDLEMLIKLVKKYPVGYAGRWEKIAETMRRNVGEVTHMAAKLKDNCYRLPGQVENSEEIPGLEVPKKVGLYNIKHEKSIVFKLIVPRMYYR